MMAYNKQGSHHLLELKKDREDSQAQPVPIIQISPLVKNNFQHGGTSFIQTSLFGFSTHPISQITSKAQFRFEILVVLPYRF